MDITGLGAIRLGCGSHPQAFVAVILSWWERAAIIHSDDLLTRVTHRTGADGLAAAWGFLCGFVSLRVCFFEQCTCTLRTEFGFFYVGDWTWK